MKSHSPFTRSPTFYGSASPKLLKPHSAPRSASPVCPILARTNHPDFAAIEAKHDADSKTQREEAARRRAEDVAFRERLLDALALHNHLLSRLVDRSAREGRVDRELPPNEQPPNER